MTSLVKKRQVFSLEIKDVIVPPRQTVSVHLLVNQSFCPTDIKLAENSGCFLESVRTKDHYFLIGPFAPIDLMNPRPFNSDAVVVKENQYLVVTATNQNTVEKRVFSATISGVLANFKKHRSKQ